MKRFQNYRYARQSLAWCLVRAGKPAAALPHLDKLAPPPGGTADPLDRLLRAWAAHKAAPTPQTAAALEAALRLDGLLGDSPAACAERLRRGWVPMLDLRLLRQQTAGSGEKPSGKS